MATGAGSSVEALSSSKVLVACIVVGLPDVALAVARFVALEVIEGLCAAIRERSAVAVVGIVAVIDVAVEAMVTVEPRAGADEDATVEPVGTVVAVGGAVVGGVVEIAVGAVGWGSDADGDLSGGDGGAAHRSAAAKVDRARVLR